MDQPTATIIAASLVFLGTIVGFVGGMVVARTTYRQKSDELFFKALDFLGGGSQKRNLGIAAIELYWSDKRHRPVSVSLLIGSALYLLSESKQDDAADELHNLDRIMTHLVRPESRSATSRTQYKRLLAALEAAEKPGRTSGLAIPAPQVSEWKKKVHPLAADLS